MEKGFNMTEFENFVKLLQREGYLPEMEVVYRGLDDIIKLDCTGIIFYFKDGLFTGVENLKSGM